MMHLTYTPERQRIAIQKKAGSIRLAWIFFFPAD